MIKIFFFLLQGFLITSVYSAPLPRFVSLKSNKANMHVGPGKQYPIVWQFIRKGTPLEIVEEFDVWRRIKDFQGAEGWMHKSLLCGKRTVCVLKNTQSFFSKPDEKATVIAYLEPGVTGKFISCEGLWCKIQVKSKEGDLKGWVKRANLWGVYPHESK